jgi:hypothetical protein
MNMPAFLSSRRKEELHGFHPCHGGEDIIKIDAFSLHKTACHQESLVLDDGTGFIPLQLEHPLKGDRDVITREISKLPGVVFSTAFISNCIAARHVACLSASTKD